MTTLEINKEIALIRFSMNISKPIENEWKEGDVAIFSHGKNWAENISDAWQLFEEMPYSKIEIWGNANPDKKYSVSFTDNMGTKYIYASTAPMAICLAWLRRKSEPMNFKDIVTMS